MKDGKNGTDRGDARNLGLMPRLYAVATTWLASCGAISFPKLSIFCDATSKLTRRVAKKTRSLALRASKFSCFKQWHGCA